MQRLAFLFATLLQLAALIGVASDAFAGELPSRYKRWLNEQVVYIIAPSERKEFLELETDTERDRFIRQFWRIRDPDLSTEANEYRTEHEARIGYANKHFHSGVPGWKTDRGRVYIMHGPPDSVNFTMGGGKLVVRVRNPTEVLTEGSGDQRNFFPVELDSPQAETWVYKHLPTAESTLSYFQIIFSRADTQQLYQLKDTLSRVDGRGSYEERYARDVAIKRFQSTQAVNRQMQILYAGEYRFQGVDDFVQSIFNPFLAPTFSRIDLQNALRDLARSPGEVLQENLRRQRRLEELVESRIFFEEFQMSVSHRFLRDDSGTTLIPLTIGLDSELAGESIEILIEMVRANGERSALVVDSMPVGTAATETEGEYLYQSRIRVQPGPQQLRVYGYLSERKAIATFEKRLQVPDFSGSDLMVSEVLLFQDVLPRQSSLQKGQEPAYASRFLGGSTPVILDEHVLIPSSQTRFRRSQDLTLLFEVYNPGLLSGGREPDLNLQCHLWQGEQLVGRVPEKNLNYFTESGKEMDGHTKTTYGLSIPLRTLSPGDYRLEFVVEDSIVQQSVATTASFQVY